MMGGARGFTRSADPQPHGARTRAILVAHPEVREEISKNPWSFAFIILLVALQFTLAFSLRAAPWWALLAVAYTVGAVADHALFVLVHECAHHLIFRKRAANTWAGIVANLPSVLPTSVSFARYHLKHHSYQGVYELDADLPSEWEARLVGCSPRRKAAWLLLYPIFQMLRAFRIREVSLFDRWQLVNMAVVFAVDAGVIVLLGPRAFLYLLAAVFFSVGLHPVGARWIQRHWLVEDDGQETYSYYGRMNALAFNVGYHNEHHDFPSIPWNRLPAVRETAPEYYRDLASHISWSRLLVRFLLDPELTLFSRMVRDRDTLRRRKGPASAPADAAGPDAPLAPDTGVAPEPAVGPDAPGARRDHPAPSR